MDYQFLIVIAVILLSTKMFGLVSRRVHMPAVVGALIAGLILGPSGFNVFPISDFIAQTAQIGVIMLMFLAGLDTDLNELKETGLASIVIAILGVVLPLFGGFFVYKTFFGIPDTVSLLKAIFIGVVLTATSVSITVETLREMGKLKGKMGTAILGAAIIDDIIGIIILTLITSFNSSGASSAQVFGKILGFFVFLLVAGVLAYLAFKKLDQRAHEKRRVAIYGLAFCFILSYCAEHFFGVADITGAYFAGIILCSLGAREYIAKKINITSYMLFAPIFFASIGLKTDLSGLTSALMIFGFVLLVVAILTKIIGCSAGALMCKFPKMEALAIGIGMVSRGEVALIVAEKGSQAGLLDANLFPPIVLVVIITTLLTPIMLKMVLKDKNKPNINNSIE